MVIKKDWVCININERYNNKARFKDVKKELENIFGNTLIDLLFIGEFLEEDVFDNILDNYVFVKCKDIYSCRQKLMRSKIIKGILNSFNEIQFISDEEINILKKDWEEKKKKKFEKIFFGDIVRVKSGLFSNLVGIVINKTENGNYIVIFKLYSRFKQIELCHSNIKRETNIFDYIRVPLT